MRDTTTAEHEAAHLVVGLALGLKLKRASLTPTDLPKGWTQLGYTWFAGGDRRGLALSLMYCAGVAWEARQGGDAEGAAHDRQLARQYFTSAHDLKVGVRIADELLKARRKAHARVASELCERDLGPRDVAALVLDV